MPKSVIPQDFKQNFLETGRLCFSRKGSYRSNPDEGQSQEENEENVPVQRTIARTTRVIEPETIKPSSRRDQPCSKGKPNRFECLKASETIHSVCRQDLPPHWWQVSLLEQAMWVWSLKFLLFPLIHTPGYNSRVCDKHFDSSFKWSAQLKTGDCLCNNCLSEPFYQIALKAVKLTPKGWRFVNCKGTSQCLL